MKIAIIASEAAPFAKTGGLADVAGALPKALFRLGHQPALIMPLHRAVRASNASLSEAGRIRVPVGNRIVEGILHQGLIPGTTAPAYFIEQDRYYDRDGLYGTDDGDYADNAERFVFLSRGALEALRLIDFHAEVLHLHDWPTALVAPYHEILYRDDPVVGDAAVLLTIHNIAYQGIFRHWDMALIGLDWSYFNWRQFEFWGKVNLLKAGIVFADAINTVSPTYAAEIETPEHGQGLDGVLRDRDAVLHGVVNGIDDAVWNPAADPNLTTAYGPEDLSGKSACKRALQRQCKLSQRKSPLLGIVSRFAHQKGLDLVAEALPRLIERDEVQCVILGDGDNQIEHVLKAFEAGHPKQVRITARYDERMAHRIIAGADMILAPSRFEPCGLTPLYALKYGSVPIVRNTGGLADTVVDCTPETLAAGQATGFVFQEPSASALAACVERALEVYRDRKAWEKLMCNGMAQDWSWEASARKYLGLYTEARKARKKR